MHKSLIDPQVDRFKQATREFECDDDDGSWEERLRKVAQQKPRSEKPRFE